MTVDFKHNLPKENHRGPWGARPSVEKWVREMRILSKDSLHPIPTKIVAQHLDCQRPVNIVITNKNLKGYFDHFKKQSRQRQKSKIFAKWVIYSFCANNNVINIL